MWDNYSPIWSYPTKELIKWFWIEDRSNKTVLDIASWFSNLGKIISDGWWTYVWIDPCYAKWHRSHINAIQTNINACIKTFWYNRIIGSKLIWVDISFLIKEKVNELSEILCYHPKIYLEEWYKKLQDGKKTTLESYKNNLQQSEDKHAATSPLLFGSISPEKNLSYMLYKLSGSYTNYLVSLLPDTKIKSDIKILNWFYSKTWTEIQEIFEEIIDIQLSHINEIKSNSDFQSKVLPNVEYKAMSYDELDDNYITNANYIFCNNLIQHLTMKDTTRLLKLLSEKMNNEQRIYISLRNEKWSSNKKYLDIFSHIWSYHQNQQILWQGSKQDIADIVKRSWSQ